MTMTRIERAEKLSAIRMIIFYLLGIVMIISAVMMFDHSGTAFLAPLICWVVMAVLASLNLTPWATRWRAGSLSTLLDDEGTQLHRRMSFEVGFWATICCSTALMVTSSFVPLQASDIARLILSVALSSALISFATLEWLATRG